MTSSPRRAHDDDTYPPESACNFSAILKAWRYLSPLIGLCNILTRRDTREWGAAALEWISTYLGG